MESLFGRKTRAPGGTLVLYTTRHGATQRYAGRIGEKLDALVKEAAYARIAQAKTYDAIVVGCPVYAGQIKGMEFLADYAGELTDKRLVLFTCGLYDPADARVRGELEAQIEAKLGGAAKHVSVFHLRGALRWQSLGLMERLMMKALLSGAKKKPEAARSETERLLIESEGGALDFSDEADLQPIVRAALLGGEADA